MRSNFRLGQGSAPARTAGGRLAPADPTDGEAALAVIQFERKGLAREGEPHNPSGLMESPLAARTERLTGTGFELLRLPAFLSVDECAHLIAAIDRDRRPSETWDPNADPDFRTSETCWMDHRDPVVGAVLERIARLLGIDQSHGERMQGQRYAPGQRYKPHHDFLRTDRPHWREQSRMGGQRSWTAMVFLNRPEAGGATRFPLAGLRVEPEAGCLLAWNNLDPEGEPNHASLHEGCPVEAGAKYIVTLWFRERPCRAPGLRAAARRLAARAVRMLRFD